MLIRCANRVDFEFSIAFPVILAASSFRIFRGAKERKFLSEFFSCKFIFRNNSFMMESTESEKKEIKHNNKSYASHPTIRSFPYSFLEFLFLSPCSSVFAFFGLLTHLHIVLFRLPFRLFFPSLLVRGKRKNGVIKVYGWSRSVTGSPRSYLWEILKDFLFPEAEAQNAAKKVPCLALFRLWSTWITPIDDFSFVMSCETLVWLSNGHFWISKWSFSVTSWSALLSQPHHHPAWVFK